MQLRAETTLTSLRIVLKIDSSPQEALLLSNGWVRQTLAHTLSVALKGWPGGLACSVISGDVEDLVGQVADLRAGLNALGESVIGAEAETFQNLAC